MTVHDLYNRHCREQGSTNPHLPRLRALAEQCKTVVEFGAKHGRSATAFLAAGCEVWSYDIVATANARQLEQIAGPRWHYVIADSRTADVPQCDLLFIDSLHTYEQVRDELAAHGDKARKLLVFHDTVTFGIVGAAGESGHHAYGTKGICGAIAEWMSSRPEWCIKANYPDSHGLLVLMRQ